MSLQSYMLWNMNFLLPSPVFRVICRYVFPELSFLHFPPVVSYLISVSWCQSLPALSPWHMAHHIYFLCLQTFPLCLPPHPIIMLKFQFGGLIFFHLPFKCGVPQGSVPRCSQSPYRSHALPLFKYLQNTKFLSDNTHYSLPSFSYELRARISKCLPMTAPPRYPIGLSNFACPN